jgi:benzoylformate decarboxylase
VPTVRDATLASATALGLTTWYGNPGSTEIPLLADLPDHLRYVLALHEHSAVTMAAGHALATGRPVLVNLHTTAGLGNAVSALATARLNRAPLVVLVGQQDRRHLAFEPFLTGRLQGLAGDYPVSVHMPLRAQDVPGAVARARHEAAYHRGPALVIVPMGDWAQEMDDTELAAPQTLDAATAVAARQLEPLVALIDSARAPVLVTGAGSDSDAAWDAVVSLADRLACPVWQEPFSARAGFPQDHPRFAGFLPAGRAGVRQTLAGHDMVLVIGAGILKQFHFEPGPLFVEGTVAAVVTDDPGEAVRSPARLALVAPIAAACAGLADRVAPRRPPPSPPGTASSLSPATGPWPSVASEPSPATGPSPPVPRGAAPEGIRPEDVFAALGARLHPDTVVVEESPSSRDALQAMVPARHPLGFLSAAMGGLGFALGAATGIRLADPRRPVLAVLGDGSAVYGIQALWSAAHYGVGVLFIVLDNASYRTMNRLVARQGKAPWPDLGGVHVDGLARALGCPALTVSTKAELSALLDEVVPGLSTRAEPLLVNVVLDEPPIVP